MSSNIPVEPRAPNCWRYSGDNFLVADSFDGWCEKLAAVNATLQVVDDEMNSRMK